MKKLLLVLLLASSQAFAQIHHTTSASLVAGGIEGLSNSKKIKASKEPLPLEERVTLSSTEQSMADDARQFFREYSSVLSVLVVHKGRIVYETYRWPAKKSTTQFSWSMSKSLTSYTIGQSLCQGNIQSLDESADTYAKNLEGTVYGRAQIKQLLIMSSGAQAPAPGLSSHRNGHWEELHGRRNTVVNVLKEFPDQAMEPGSKFAYKNADTLALGLVLEGSGGFFKQFDELFWSKTRPENASYWLTDRNDKPVAAAGFSATARDWARAGAYIIRVHNRQEDSECFQNYVRDAHRPQIRGYDGPFLRAYGYQVWIRLHGVVSWEGWGGQRVFLDPKNELIWVISSTDNNHYQKSTDLFYKWNKALINQ